MYICEYRIINWQQSKLNSIEKIRLAKLSNISKLLNIAINKLEYNNLEYNNLLDYEINTDLYSLRHEEDNYIINIKPVKNSYFNSNNDIEYYHDDSNKKNLESFCAKSMFYRLRIWFSEY